MDHPALIERRTKLVRVLLPDTAKNAVSVLRAALNDGLLELETIQQTQVNNVSVQFWLNEPTGRWSRTGLDGTPMLDTFYPSDLIHEDNVADIARQVRLGYLKVTVYQGIVPYLQEGHEPSVDALADLMLCEAARVAWLNLPMPFMLVRLIDAFCGSRPARPSS